jgi:3'-5' exonuclease
VSKRIFLDIETLPPVESFREKLAKEIYAEPGPDELGPDEEEIDVELERRFRNLALRGEWGRLLCIGLVIEEDGVIRQCGALGRDRETRQFHMDEARTLKAFWKLVAGFREGKDLFIGHNLLDFDLPFLYKRSCIHGIKPSVRLSFRRFQPSPVFDTMWEWTKWRKLISLHELAQALGIPSPKESGVDGLEIYDLYQQGRHEEIAEYCMRDVKCTREVFYRLQYETVPALTSYECPAVESPMVETVSTPPASRVLADV